MPDLPLRAHCAGQSRAEQLPVKPPKKAKAQRMGHAFGSNAMVRSG
jgi:A/G-specific adenine glycosylase